MTTPTTDSTPTAPGALTRPRIVWGALALSMTLVGGLLMLSDATPDRAEALPVAAGLTDQKSTIADVLSAETSLESDRWSGIVIHHSGELSGSAETLDQRHRENGLRGMGFHFVIANGRGDEDGTVRAGDRWAQQLPGAHCIGPDADTHNRRSIGVCLVGDGNSKAFTDRQLASLVALVQRLQREFDIPEDRVFLHTDVAPTASPGRLFPAGAFRAMLDDAG